MNFRKLEKDIWIAEEVTPRSTKYIGIIFFQHGVYKVIAGGSVLIHLGSLDDAKTYMQNKILVKSEYEK